MRLISKVYYHLKCQYTIATKYSFAKHPYNTNSSSSGQSTYKYNFSVMLTFNVNFRNPINLHSCIDKGRIRIELDQS